MDTDTIRLTSNCSKTSKTYCKLFQNLKKLHVLQLYTAVEAIRSQEDEDVA